MTTPTKSALKASAALEDAPLLRQSQSLSRTEIKRQAATIIDAAMEQERAALRDAQDFLQAIEDATTGGGKIDEDSIMRYGERLKTTARKLNAKP